MLCLYCSVVRELVKQNRMVVNDEDEDSNTALHLAALAGHNKVVQALIENGADIEARYEYETKCSAVENTQQLS